MRSEGQPQPEDHLDQEGQSVSQSIVSFVPSFSEVGRAITPWSQLLEQLCRELENSEQAAPFTYLFPPPPPFSLSFSNSFFSRKRALSGGGARSHFPSAWRCRLERKYFLHSFIHSSHDAATTKPRMRSFNTSHGRDCWPLSLPLRFVRLFLAPVASQPRFTGRKEVALGVPYSQC